MGAVLLGAVVPGAVLPGTGRGGSRPRIGLVLGAGHLTGAAWMTGALPALQDRLSRAISDADVIIGTSAGSVLAASIRCRCSIEEMIGYQRGEVVDGLPQVTERSRPPLPQPRMGSPALWCTALLTPHRVHPVRGQRDRLGPAWPGPAHRAARHGRPSARPPAARPRDQGHRAHPRPGGPDRDGRQPDGCAPPRGCARHVAAHLTGLA